MRRIPLLLAALALLAHSPAFAGSSTLAVTPGSGASLRVGTDGSSNLFGNGAICDGAACALLASVNAAGTPGTNGLAIQGLTGGVPVPISAASLPLPTGASTAAGLTTINTTLGSPFQAGGSIGNTAFIANAGTNLNTSLLALETGGNLASIKTDVDNLNLAQGSTTSGQKGNLALGTVTTAAPGYTTAQSSPLSLTTAGALRTDSSASTQPVSGTVTAAQATAASLNATVVGTGTFAAQLTGATNNINNIAGTVSLPTGAATSANQTNASQKTQIVDGSGNAIASTTNALNVQCANCSGSGVSTIDGAVWANGTSLFAGIGGAYQTTATTNPLTNNHQGFAQLTQYRALMNAWFNTSGVEMGTSTTPVQVSLANTGANATAVAVNPGTVATWGLVAQGGAAAATNAQQAGGVYNSSAPTLTTGQGAALQLTAAGSLHATVDNTLIALINSADGVAPVSSVTATAGNSPVNSYLWGFDGTNFDRIRTSASGGHLIVEGAGTAGTASGGVASVQGVASMTPLLTNPGTAANWGLGATGSGAPANAQYVGANSSGNLTGVIQADHSVPINISTATTTQLVALSGSTKIYVSAWDVVAGGTGNITLEYGTGTACATGTTALTGAYNLIAQAGLTKGSGLGPVLIVPAGNALCALTSAAVQMSGSLAYTQF